ncbi:hypothetical protein ABEB36_001782 [Hypothenemus hampei]|uniref:Uncharacterized protein n=1 Tax=Hypothenemus hampei TaxID=57062 RepID=A0ABD1FIW2_HYPHA
MQIKNSVFLVLGGATSALGYATVEVLLKEGAKVIICDLPNADLNIFGHDKAIFLPLDICSHDDLTQLLEVIKDKYKRLDGVINCVDYRASTPIDQSENIKDVFYVHPRPFQVIMSTLPLIMAANQQKGKRGVIVNVANMAAYEGRAQYCAYAASKAALIRMSQVMHQELLDTKVRCVCILIDEKFELPDKFTEFLVEILQKSSMNYSLFRCSTVLSKN